jgi:hypothetical protein
MSATRAALVFFIFDLVHLDGDEVAARLLIERKARLARKRQPVTATAASSEGSAQCRPLSARLTAIAGGIGHVGTLGNDAL